MNSWVSSANSHGDFPLANLPYGVFSIDGGDLRTGVAIGDMIYDLQEALKRACLREKLERQPNQLQAAH